MSDDTPRFTFLGKLVSLLLVAGLVYYGVVLARQRGWWPGSKGGRAGGAGGGEEQGSAAEVIDVQAEVPRLAPPAPYQMKDDTVVIEISEYAGYAGLIAANGGLEPNPNSVFAQNGGFKLKLTISEDESWSALNAGQDGRVGHHGGRARRVRVAVQGPWCRRRSASRAAPTASW